MNKDLIRVDFHGDVIDCLEENGKVWVSIRRVCESLSIDFARQLKKLKAKAWACVDLKAIHDTTGREQDAAMLDLDSLPMWLATIESSRVAEAVRPKLVEYQKECARVLRDHFFGKAKEAEPIDPLEANLAILRVLATNTEEQIRQNRLLASVQNKVETLEGKFQQIERRQEQAREDMLALPKPTVAVPARPMRKAISECVRQHAFLASGGDHESMKVLCPEAWNLLYREFRDRYCIDLRVCARNRKVSTLDYCESIDRIPELYSLSVELFQRPVQRDGSTVNRIANPSAN